MEKKKTLLFATTAVCAAMMATVVLASNGGMITNAFAFNQTNEYGCSAGCTGEYYPSHVKSILKEDASKNGEKNVRIKCEYIKDVYFKDMGAILSYSADSDNEAMVIDVGFTWWNEENADYRSMIKPGDIVCMYGTVYYEFYGVKRLVVRDPVIYGVNSNINTSLLPEVNYIG